MNDALLLAALRELGDCLSAVDVPQGVLAAFPRLRKLQIKFFVTVFDEETTTWAGTTYRPMSLQPTDLLLKCLAAARAKDWPRFIVLVQSTPLELNLPEGLEDNTAEQTSWAESSLAQKGRVK
jgi:hypothetical protein